MSVTTGSIILYRSGDSDSLEFANYYISTRGISDITAVSVPCSENEVLDSYTDFLSEVENPVKAILGSAKIIIIGYNVPGGFYQGSSIISSQSRLSRINHDPSWGMANPLFDRKNKTYSDADKDIALIVSRIDAPSLTEAKSMVDNIAFVSRKPVANGRILFDKYSNIELDEYGIADAQFSYYYDELVDFEDFMLPILNLEVYSTTFFDESTDVVIPRASKESFIWSYKSETVGNNFFQSNNKSRIFLYSADSSGGSSMRNIDDMRWSLMGMLNGYAASAGAMSDPLPEGFLRPRPFFDALYRGATIGEAFLFACPNLDWTVGLFGDPFIKVSFFGTELVNDQYTVQKGFYLMNKSLQDAIGYKQYGDKLLEDLYADVLTNGDVNTLFDMYKSVVLARNVYEQTKDIFYPLVSTFEGFSTNNESLDGYLALNSLKISEQVVSLNPSEVFTQLFDQYSWYFETPILRITSEFNMYHFQIQVSLYSDFSEILYDISSIEDVDNWFYEKEVGIFFALPERGVSSGFSGRYVKYIAPESKYFSEKNIFYIRYRQVNEFTEYTDWTTYKQVIGT